MFCAVYNTLWVHLYFPYKSEIALNVKYNLDAYNKVAESCYTYHKSLKDDRSCYILSHETETIYQRPINIYCLEDKANILSNLDVDTF